MTARNKLSSIKLYVAAPANLATGGPELLHQLVHELNRMGIESYMYYYNIDSSGILTHSEYVSYGNPVAQSIIDSKENILIVPEGKTALLYKYKNIKKMIWWLSVDNYYHSFKSSTFLRTTVKFLRRLSKLDIVFEFSPEKIKGMLHLVQSKYAEQHLISKGVATTDIYFLSDYLNNTFIKSQIKTPDAPRENIILYNPKKGKIFTELIIRSAPQLKFVPIINMTRAEVSKLMLSAKVYIDFGEHPGKDRIPREAAISGLCVITNKKGSAKYTGDVPIDEEFKFAGDGTDVSVILNKIESCLINFEIETKKFESYRTFICNEQNVFIESLNNIFKACESDSFIRRNV